MKDLIAKTHLLYMRAIVEDWPLRRLYWELALMLGKHALKAHKRQPASPTTAQVARSRYADTATNQHRRNHG